MLEFLKKLVTNPTFWWVFGAVVVSGILLWIASYFVGSYFVYINTLSRTSKKQWRREVPSNSARDTVEMFETGVAWAKKNVEYKKDVQITRDGLNLYGEYYDFGYDRCAMILSGRTEGLCYGYYFAIPYAANGCNILVVDPRAHGQSDGKYNTIGFEESLDDIAWVNFLRDEMGVKSLIFHGICIGAAGGMYASTHENCPDIVKGIVVEGMFPNFGKSMKNNLKQKKKPVFIVWEMIDVWMKKYTGYSMKFGPINVIEKLDKPLLMLHSKEDKSSLPEDAQKLYDLAGTKKKQLVWFEKGKHSMIRITDTEKYDNTIANFLKELE